MSSKTTPFPYCIRPKELLSLLSALPLACLQYHKVGRVACILLAFPGKLGHRHHFIILLLRRNPPLPFSLSSPSGPGKVSITCFMLDYTQIDKKHASRAHRDM